jgi:predicted MFS family arabinose efflux permease
VSRPLSYGWVVLGAAFVIVTMAIGTLFCLAVFLKPLEDSMGWARSSVSAVALINWISMGTGSFVSGYLSDRFGTRRVVLAGGGRVDALWQFYVVFGVLVGFGVSCFYVPLTVTAIRWFEHRRGLAASIVSSGNGLGTLALAPLTRWLINAYDWRMAFLLLGELALLVVVSMALLLRAAPSASAAPAMGRASAAPGSLWTSQAFWAIALTHFACCSAHSGPIFHMVTHAMERGVPALAAAGALGVSGLTSIVGRVGTGIIADRVGAKPTLIAGLVLQAVTIFLYVFPGGPGTLYALAMVFGVGYGSVMPLYAVVTREYFGEKAIGTAYGGVFFISCIGMGLGSYAGGVIHDALGSYLWLFIGSGTIATMAAVLAVTLRPPQPVLRRA